MGEIWWWNLAGESGYVARMDCVTDEKPNSGYRYRHVVAANSSDDSIVNYFAVVFPHSTVGAWGARLDAGEVTVDGRPIGREYRPRPGQVLIWNRPGWIEEPAPRNYGIIYRDDRLLVVDKPSGLPTLPGGGFYRNTLLDVVRSDFPLARPLHRLGRGTSGLVMFALDSETASLMQSTWSRVSKVYRALAQGVATQDEYDIRSPIGKCSHPSLGDVYGANPEGKSSRSVARVVGRRASATLFDVDLHTGRPHQIRIHLAFIGHPLVGDPLYDLGGIPRRERPGLPGETGYFLHAQELRFLHPSIGNEIHVTSPLPEMLRLQ